MNDTPTRPREYITPEQERLVVKLYKQGLSTAEITRRSRVKRSAIYTVVLPKYQITPNRLRKGAPITLSDAMARIRELEKQLATVTSERDAYRTTLDTLVELLGPNRQAAKTAANRGRKQAMRKGGQ